MRAGDARMLKAQDRRPRAAGAPRGSGVVGLLESIDPLLGTFGAYRHGVEPFAVMRWL
jgi:hypothetical protein